MEEQCTVSGLQGTLQLTNEALRVLYGKTVSIHVPLGALCGATANQHVPDQFHVIYHSQGQNLSFNVQCATALAAQGWVRSLREALGAWRGVQQPPVLLLVNPISGRGKARATVATAVMPVLEASGAIVELRETERVGHGEEIVRTAQLQENHIIAVCSGDGILHEVVNGLLNRPDAEAVCSKVKLAIIPGGSGNALAACLGMQLVDTAVWGIVQGRTRALNIAAFWQQGKRRFMFINMLATILSDIDFDSEPLRKLGPTRFTLYGILEVLRFRCKSYRIKLELLAADKVVQEECLEVDCKRCTPYSPLKVPEVFHQDFCEGFTWRTIEDSFPFFTLQNGKHGSIETKACPYAHLSDGTVDICLLRGATRPNRYEVARVLLALEAGNHMTAVPKMEYFKVKAMRFTPLYEGGQFGIDGEHMPFTPLDLQVCEGGLRVICLPGPAPAVSGLPGARPGVQPEPTAFEGNSL